MAVALGLMLGAVGPSAVAGEVPEPIPWGDDYLATLKEAERQSRPVLVYFWADWCGPCRQMEATTLRDNKVVSVAKEFVPLKVEAGGALAGKLGVSIIPMLIVLDGEGNRITSRLGFQEAAGLRESLERVQDDYARYLEDLRDVGDFAAARRVVAYLVKVRNSGRAVDVLESALRRISKSDAARRTRAELDVAEARELHGDLSGAAHLYSKLSNAGSDRELRAKALYRLATVERRRGRPRRSAEALDRLAHEYPDLRKSDALREGALAD